MSKIEIETLDDEHECETCGPSWAEGAIVKIDGVIALELEPAAHCFAGESYDLTDVLLRVIRHLGHDVVIDRVGDVG